MLGKSIKTLEENLILKKQKEIFYNYVLIDANALVCLLKDIGHKKEPSIDDLVFLHRPPRYRGDGVNTWLFFISIFSHLMDQSEQSR